MIVGVPAERKEDEYRVALTPAGARELAAHGHTVLVERGAGEGSALDDGRFVATGARIVEGPEEVWSSADLVLKVKEPEPEEYPFLGRHRGQVLFTYLHLAASRACTEALVTAGNTAIAYETVRLPDGSLPLLRPMSEVAGRMAPLVAAHHLMRPGGGRGSLLTGVPGVHAAKVVVLGAGVAGMAAAAVAVGLHARVTLLDRDLDRLRAADSHFRGGLETVASSAHAVEEACVGADVVIGAVLVAGARAPLLVPDDLVREMPTGSVLVDLSVDQGGCFQSSRPTTHSHPTFPVAGSLFYCVANMPGAVPHTSTQALVNATLPYALDIADHGWEGAVRRSPVLAAGVNVTGGTVVCRPVAEAHGLAWTPLEHVLAALPGDHAALPGDHAALPGDHAAALPGDHHAALPGDQPGALPDGHAGDLPGDHPADRRAGS